MVCRKTKSVEKADGMTVVGRVLAIYRQETCCVYVVKTDDGCVAQLKREYEYCGECINVEDAIRCAPVVGYKR
jgi:hypothetical protein